MAQQPRGKDARDIRITQTVKDCVADYAIAGGGYVVTVATIVDAMDMMSAVKNMAMTTGGVSWHLKYCCVMFHSTVELIK